MFFGHLWELVVVLLIALVVFGPKRLPEVGSALGRGLHEFRKATSELQDRLTSREAEPGPPGRHTAAGSSTSTNTAGSSISTNVKDMAAPSQGTTSPPTA
jgi:sec-independent protein translocase protein TatA